MDAVLNWIRRHPLASLLGLFVFAVFTSGACDLRHDLVMAGRTAPVQGIVRGVRRNQHALIDYAYNYNGTSYQGTDQSRAPNPTELEVGQPALVFVDTRTPSVSMLGDPRMELEGDRRAFIFGGVLACAYVLAVLRMQTRRHLG